MVKVSFTSSVTASLVAFASVASHWNGLAVLATCGAEMAVGVDRPGGAATATAPTSTTETNETNDTTRRNNTFNDPS